MAWQRTSVCSLCISACHRPAAGNLRRGAVHAARAPSCLPAPPPFAACRPAAPPAPTGRAGRKPISQRFQDPADESADLLAMIEEALSSSQDDDEDEDGGDAPARPGAYSRQNTGQRAGAVQYGGGGQYGGGQQYGSGPQGHVDESYDYGSASYDYEEPDAAGYGGQGHYGADPRAQAGYGGGYAGGGGYRAGGGGYGGGGNGYGGMSYY